MLDIVKNTLYLRHQLINKKKQMKTQNFKKVYYKILKTTNYCPNCGRIIINKDVYCADCI